MNSNQVKGFLAGIIAAVCYGTNPLGTLELYHDGFSSGSVLTYRYLLAVVMFAIVLLVRRESFAIKWGHAIRLACLGSFFALSSPRSMSVSIIWPQESQVPCFLSIRS